VLSDGPAPADRWLADVLRWCWRVKLQMHFESELFARLRESAEAEAIRVFGANLKDLLLGAPAGPKAVPGLDPGLRAACDLTLCLGAMTWPHMLVRVLIAEQLYRAQSILAGHPYHRA
jgi:rRNA large subunit m3Psi methyltransferase RlmH